MTPGDSVRVTIGGRVYEAEIKSMRDGTARLDFHGKRKPLTLPIDRCTHVKRTGINDGPPLPRKALTLREPSPAFSEAYDAGYAVPLKAVPKPKPPWRSSAYMAHVRMFACCVSGELTEEAHHHGPHAMGRKGPDWTCVPLSHAEHERFHRTGAFRGMTREETDAHAIQAQIECMTDWCEARGLDYMTAVRDALARVVEGDG